MRCSIVPSIVKQCKPNKQPKITAQTQTTPTIPFHAVTLAISRNTLNPTPYTKKAPLDLTPSRREGSTTPALPNVCFLQNLVAKFVVFKRKVDNIQL
ncbi:hypothetical protein NDU88_001979 [Pleurodeles waltl]|uniref:Uncharacterized protein n=1 Tax=Pleurodeles waltl TaxID=8319 RepID=A0AAV7P5I7_PLEWA|nr:hypothetical protein NDU88_001979 [Pleurodeles waltl]